MSGKKPRWMDGLYRSPSRAAIAATTVGSLAVMLAAVVVLLRVDDPVLWVFALLAVFSVPLYLLASVPYSINQAHANTAGLRCVLTLDEAERRMIEHARRSGATMGKVPGHDDLARKGADRILEMVLDGRPIVVALNWSRGWLIVEVRPVPDPVPEDFDRFMRGLDEALAAPPQRGYPTLASLPAGIDAGGGARAAIDRRHRDYARRVPKLLFWAAVLGLIAFVLSMCVTGPFVDPSVWTVFLSLCALLASPLLLFLPVLAIHAHLETLTAATMRLDGVKVTYANPGAVPEKLVLDQDALVEVMVPEGFAGWAKTPASIAGYSFERGKMSISLHQNEGFDHDDLVRIWPDVLAAAWRNHTMIGPNLELIANSMGEGPCPPLPGKEKDIPGERVG